MRIFRIFAVTVPLLAPISGFALPVIVTQPKDQTNVAGTTATFSVEAASAFSLSYQWRYYSGGASFTNMPGGGNAMLLVTNVQPVAGRYAVVVSDAEGSVTSILARLVVRVPASIATQPAGQLVMAGDTATFSVTAGGTPPIRYQWRFGDVNIVGETNATLTITNVSAANAGNYSVVVSNDYGSATSDKVALRFVPGFIQILTGPGADGISSSWCPAWADYDNDGYLDLFVASDAGTNFLYHNNGNGALIRVTNGTLAALSAISAAASWGDYNNDGFLDLIVGNGGGGSHPPQFDFLLLGEGNGDFTRITNNALVSFLGNTEGVAWADYDRDGYIDLFVTHSGTNQPNSLYHNNGDGGFTKITSGNIVTDLANWVGCSWADYDNDNYPDLFVANARGASFLYHNNGDGTFARITQGPVAATQGGFISGGWGDFDNDGYLDLFVTNSETNRPNFLYLNQRDGTFTRVVNGAIVTDAANSQSSGWADFDNDGYLDLFVVNFNAPNFFYHNRGDGTFDKIEGTPITAGLDAVTCAWGDYDNDGFLDLCVLNHRPTAPRPNLLYRNQGNNNTWLKVKCNGAASNRSGIGVKLRVKATIAGQTVWQLREITGGDSWCSQNNLIAHFGLGDATNVETLRIEWPSGTVQELNNVAAKQFLTITEPPALRAIAKTPNGSFHLELTGGLGFRYDLERSTNLVTWTPWLSLTNAARTTLLLDTNAANTNRRFYRAVTP